MNTDNIEQLYEETTEWMFRQIPMFQDLGANAYKPGLERVTVLAEAFGSPHRRIRTIHVAGTNGKGSTSSLLASVLTENSLRTGLFTSPHLIDFRERIRIDGEMISKAEVVDFIKRYRAMNLDIEPSFFELTTVMALDWFASRNVDVAVIEVGLGGRLDSTNIINPLVSVITNISLDHTALLGDTPELIAYEKAGIIKKDIPVVIGRAEGGVRKVFEEKAQAECAPVYFAQDNILYAKVSQCDDFNTYTGTPWGNIDCPLTGDCQVENANTVFNVLKHLPINLNPEKVADGFRNVCLNSGLMGRWTVVSRNPAVVCDTGHNPGGWQYLGSRLEKLSENAPLRMVIGFVNDKDVSSVLKMMPASAEYYFTAPSVKRARTAESLKTLADELGLKGKAYRDVAEAFEAAKNGMPTDGTIFVGGSTFVVADFMNFSKKVEG